jgi:hypothetical protein
MHLYMEQEKLYVGSQKSEFKPPKTYFGLKNPLTYLHYFAAPYKISDRWLDHYDFGAQIPFLGSEDLISSI